MRGRDGTGRRTVECIACGETVPRPAAREYDKEGNRWERRDKAFEYLCPDCYRDLCHQPRAGLEELLTDVEATADSRDEFLRAYVGAIQSRKEHES